MTLKDRELLVPLAEMEKSAEFYSGSIFFIDGYSKDGLVEFMLVGDISSLLFAVSDRNAPKRGAVLCEFKFNSLTGRKTVSRDTLLQRLDIFQIFYLKDGIVNPYIK